MGRLSKQRCERLHIRLWYVLGCVAQKPGGGKGVIDIVDGSQYPLTIPSPGRRGDMNCDHCKYYRWYYDRCERWDC